MTETVDVPVVRVSHYRILHPIASGGIGDVFLALDETLKRKVALKSLQADHRLNGVAKARFLREARILSQLDHPSICRALDYIEDGDHDWLVLEYIEGRTLRDAIRDGVDAATALRISERIAAVLVVTHAAGIIHRDLKPGNVMLTPAGEVKVLDFGLARSDIGQPSVAASPALPFASWSDEDSTHAGDEESTRPDSVVAFQTQLGSISGTPAYMSPEQARGETATSASDMFSFGLLLQELFTGRRAYPREEPGPPLLERVQAGATSPPDGAPPDIAVLVRRLTSFAPSQRPTAVEAAERLRWFHGKPKRRIRALLSAAAVLVMIAAAAKYTVDLRRERTIAVAAREDADRRRGQAEDLIGFMLGDLRAKLSKAGKLDLLEGVGERAMKYFAAVPAASLSNEELFRRAQAVQQIGQIEQTQGHLKTATAAYRESLTAAIDVARRDPSNADWQLAVGTAHFYVGEVLRRQGDLTGAMKEYESYRDVAQALVDRDPGNDKWLLELSFGHGGVASIQEAAGDLAGAKRELEFALAIKTDLARRQPSKVEWQQSLSTGHNRLGAVLDKLGDAAGAMQHYRANLEICKALVDADPANNAIKRNYLVPLTFVTRAYEESGDLAQATAHAREARDVAAALAAVDARNADWQRDLSVAEGRLAGILRFSGALADAHAANQLALARLRPLATDAKDVARQRDLAALLLNDGWTRLARNDARGAEDAAASVESILAPLLARKKDTDMARLGADARLLAGAIADRRGQPQRAKESRESALALVAATPTTEMRFIAVRARALIALGRSSEAAPIVRQLFAAGYKHPVLVADWAARNRQSDR